MSISVTCGWEQTASTLRKNEIKRYMQRDWRSCRFWFGEHSGIQFYDQSNSRQSSSGLSNAFLEYQRNLSRRRWGNDVSWARFGALLLIHGRVACILNRDGCSPLQKDKCFDDMDNWGGGADLRGESRWEGLRWERKWLVVTSWGERSFRLERERNARLSRKRDS